MVVLQHVRMAGEDRQIVQQEIAEVAGIQRAQALLVFAIEPQRHALGIVRLFCGGHFLRRQPPILPAFDRAQQRAGRPFLVVDVLGRQKLFQQAKLIVGIEDGEVRFQADDLGMTAQQAGAEGVECTEPPALHRPADERRDAILHLARRLVGEGDAQKLAWPRLAGHQDMGKTRGQDPRLAGPRTGQHEHGPLRRFDGGAL